MNRREFIGTMGATAAAMAVPPLVAATRDEDAAPFPCTPVCRSKERQSELLSKWDKDTELVAPADYAKYLRDGDTCGFAALEALERAFEKVMREAKETVVTGDVPAVWSVYNMGYIVKTRETLFSIDLVHRRDAEFAPMLDFALVTHDHGDHWRRAFYKSMDESGKMVISNFLGNYCAMKWKRINGVRMPFGGGYARGVKTFRIKDVEIRTSLIDHNNYLIDFTTAFEIKTGDFILYHTGDSGYGTEPKLETAWGKPDLWLFFPGCGIDTRKAVAQVKAKRIVFGHLWELGHKRGHVGSRLDEKMIRPRLARAEEAGCKEVSVAFWGDRII